MTGIQIHGAVRENEIAAVLALLYGKRPAVADSATARWRAQRREALDGRPFRRRPNYPAASLRA